MNIVIEVIGWMGAVAVLSGYGLLSMKKLRSDSYSYHGLNIAGSLLLAVYALWKTAIASVAVNVVWLGIGIGAVLALRRAGKRE